MSTIFEILNFAIGCSPIDIGKRQCGKLFEVLTITLLLLLIII